LPILQALREYSLGKPTTVTHPKADEASPAKAVDQAKPSADSSHALAPMPAEVASNSDDALAPEGGGAPLAASLFDAVVSGAFDLEDGDANVPEPRRILQPQAETPKLHKILAQSGMGSRLEMERLILEGRISVNNEPAHIGQRIQFGDHIKVNGKPVIPKIDHGYAVLEQAWSPGDVVELSLPMEVRQVVAAETVKADVDRAAIQRGPLLYCVEGADNHGQAWNILLPATAQFAPLLQPKLLGGIVTLSSKLPVMQPAKDGLSIIAQPTNVTAIPYFVWCNRGSNPMQVWLPRKIKEVDVK
jgi:hypothetical protein